MCELLGLSFNKAVETDISFTIFRTRGKTNPDGWGMAWFKEDGQFRLIEEPTPAQRTELAHQIPRLSTIRSKIFISHIRKASPGSVNYTNTHPFYRGLNGNTWVLAHNGALGRLKEPTTGAYLPIGETDSEKLFCHLLAWIKEQPETHGREFNLGLAKKLKSLNRAGSMNLLFSNGERLYAYHDANGYNGLYCLKRKAPFPSIQFADTDIKVLLGDMKDPSEEGWIVATRPHTNENWHSLHPGELVVFNSGKRVFRSSAGPMWAPKW